VRTRFVMKDGVESTRTHERRGVRAFPFPSLPLHYSSYPHIWFHLRLLPSIQTSQHSELNLGMSCFCALLSSAVWHCAASKLDVYADVETFSFQLESSVKAYAYCVPISCVH
jgi:hypothetical protein